LRASSILRWTSVPCPQSANGRIGKKIGFVSIPPKIALVTADWRWTTPSSDEISATSKLALQDVFRYLPALLRVNPANPQPTSTTKTRSQITAADSGFVSLLFPPTSK